MTRNLAIVLLAVLVIALPFIFRREPQTGGWMADDPELVIVTPHNEAIRREFAAAFSAWHRARYGRPVRIDWRAIGGTTEIMRYLAAEYSAAFKAYWTAGGNLWPEGGAEMMLDHRFRASVPLDAAADAAAQTLWRRKCELHAGFRSLDDPAAFGCKIDVFFGGGTYDHDKAHRQGLTVLPWPAEDPPDGLFTDADGAVLIPEEMSGETWRTPAFFGTALSTFGICYNRDRLRDLGLEQAPQGWSDLADPRYYGQVGLADPTKSGSIAKAFEMIIHEQCHRAVRAAGFSAEQTAGFEARIDAARLPGDRLPDEVPTAYQAAVEKGWVDGLRLVQLIAANARYFTDSASKVPIDVGMGDAAVGLAIDFYGRFQAEVDKDRDGRERLVYITPRGGSSVSADPISLLRGAEHRELAVRFVTFVLSEEGQRLWNYAPGSPGGPLRFALRRLPIRRDFYPGDTPALREAYARHQPHTVDALGDPGINPYALAAEFTYYPRWTARHFNVQRDLLRSMCMDAGDELKAAWRAILDHGGPSAQAAALECLGRLPDRPEPLDWSSALSVGRRHARMDIMREWTLFFRQNYREARRLAEEGPQRSGTNSSAPRSR